MFESKDLIDGALRYAVADRLRSAVYYALNYVVGYLDEMEDPETRDEILAEWHELGAYVVACTVVLSTLPEGPTLPHAARLIPWIAQYLRPYDESAILPIVQAWMDGEPLAEHVSSDPQDEDLKVRQLRSSLRVINGVS